MAGQYDTQQVCENGHQITAMYERNPERHQEYCDKCGSKTMTKCLQCNVEIRGYYHVPGVYVAGGTAVPSHCFNCGKPYPWTENKIVTAIQMFAEFGNLDAEEKKTIDEDIKNIAKDIPQAELSARRIKRIWAKGTKIAYSVLMEFASKTAAEVLKQ